MRKTVPMAVWTALTLTVVSLGVRNMLPASAAVLDGFAIHTEDKAVTVTLYTDQRAQYSTENHGKQFAIVLSDTELSKEQMENGLPVVIDNKNQFIGRAVPAGEGKVKIILPNLAADQYSVSVQQQRPNRQVAAAPTESTAAKPRSAVNGNSQFEAVATGLAAKQPEAEKPAVLQSRPTTSASNGFRLSPAPAIPRTSNGTVWNPYVVKVPPKAEPARTESAKAAPVSRGYSVSLPAESAGISTLSVAETPRFQQQTAPPPPGNDPLWYLHSLPPVDAGQLPADNLQGAAINPPFAAAVSIPTAAPAANAPAAPAKSALTELKEAIQALPQWLLITAALFLGGLGLFGLVGGLVLLRLLFSQVRQGAIGLGPSIALPTTYTIVPPESQAASAPVEALPERKPYATHPREMVRFEDKASVDALDYLVGTPDNMAQAVHNAVLLKFPTHRTGRSRQLPRRSVVNAKP